VQRLIQTLHGRGYRFIAPIAEHPGDTPNLREPPRSTRPPSPTEPDDGRMEALPSTLMASAAMRRWDERWKPSPRHGGRAGGNATGGGSRLVRQGLGNHSGGGLPVGIQDMASWGQPCPMPEQYGPGEAYMPGSKPSDACIVSANSRHCWRYWCGRHPPGCADALLESMTRRSRLCSAEVMGVTRDRMLREMAEAIEVLTAECPLVLVFEDYIGAMHPRSI
jgi:hypothetical protein